jgi:hypothetical protein
VVEADNLVRKVSLLYFLNNRKLLSQSLNYQRKKLKIMKRMVIVKTKKSKKTTRREPLRSSKRFMVKTRILSQSRKYKKSLSCLLSLKMQKKHKFRIKSKPMIMQMLCYNSDL